MSMFNVSFAYTKYQKVLKTMWKKLHLGQYKDTEIGKKNCQVQEADFLSNTNSKASNFLMQMINVLHCVNKVLDDSSKIFGTS